MFTPSPKLLEKYADVLVNFALWKGKGVQAGDIVYIILPECAKPFLVPLERAILAVGAHYILDYRPNESARMVTPTTKTLLENGSKEQLAFFPKGMQQGIVKEISHRMRIEAEHDTHCLMDISAENIAWRREKTDSYFRSLLKKKEQQGKSSRTIALYGTAAMAKAAGISEAAYWEQIEKACFLDVVDPVQEWKKVFGLTHTIKNWLDGQRIQSVHVKGEDIDLHVKIGDDRVRRCGEGTNIPSFEIFTSPDWRGTSGWYKSNVPLFAYGNIVKGIELTFREGVVTKAHASDNDSLLQQILRIPNANKLGEFSLTDKRCSRITKFMATTLYDENIGGCFGNTHIAIGTSFPDTYRDCTPMTKKIDLTKRGFNQSAEHVDIVSTSDRIVTALCADGSEKILYKDGMFTCDV